MCLFRLQTVHADLKQVLGEVALLHVVQQLRGVGWGEEGGREEGNRWVWEEGVWGSECRDLEEETQRLKGSGQGNIMALMHPMVNHPLMAP